MRFDQVNPQPLPIRPRPTRTRLVGMGDGKTDTPPPQNTIAQGTSANDIAMQSTLSMKTATFMDKKPPPATPYFDMNAESTIYPQTDDISKHSTTHLMQLSGMMRAIRIPQQAVPGHTQRASRNGNYDGEEGYWPYGIQQTGALPVVNLYGREPFGRNLPRTPVVMPIVTAGEVKQQPARKMFLNSPAAKVAIGLIIGVGLLL